MTSRHDNAPHESVCARCGSVIADAKGEVVMATHGRTWIVCRACARAGLHVSELADQVRPQPKGAHHGA